MTPLWKPSAARMASSHLMRFLRWAGDRRGRHFESYDSLHHWSITQPQEFWSDLAHFTDVRADWGTGPAIVRGTHMTETRFFPQARLSYTENLLRCSDARPALIFRNERGTRSALTFPELRAEVARVASGLAELGVGLGDRVAALTPNVPEAIVAALATASRGAIWTSCSPDFGVRGVLDRFGQIAPKVLFATDGYFYANKTHDTRPLIAEVASVLPSLERTVLIPYVGLGGSEPGNGRNARWESFGRRDLPFECVLTEFNHPLAVLYSSGTTGVPKCIVHGTGGTLLQHQKEHVLHTDLGPTDRLFYFTTCGWMMWNWQLSALATGAALVLYDGSPLHPDAGILWRIAQEEGVTVFGTSPKYLSALSKAGFEPAREHSLEALRTILSTGSPLSGEGFDFVYRSIKEDVHLASISGGTDIVSCFALGCPIRPVTRGEIQCRGLGMSVEVFNELGEPSIEKQGELVCTQAFPSMPLGFWGDTEKQRYRAAYFERFPGVWHHGDYAVRTDRDGLVIHGRSDAVLNPGGVRIGTAELYAAVEELNEVLESVAIAQDWEGDVRIVLFVRLRRELYLDEALIDKIRKTIRARATARHVPAKIVAVPDIPRTRSGKITEIGVRDIVHGRRIQNIEALANPEALEYFRNLAELAT